MSNFKKYVDNDGLTKVTREEVKKTPNGYSVGNENKGSKTQTEKYLRDTQKK